MINVFDMGKIEKAAALCLESFLTSDGFAALSKACDGFAGKPELNEEEKEILRKAQSCLTRNFQKITDVLQGIELDYAVMVDKDGSISVTASERINKKRQNN